jgi:hypothetical protein
MLPQGLRKSKFFFVVRGALFLNFHSSLAINGSDRDVVFNFRAVN